MRNTGAAKPGKPRGSARSTSTGIAKANSMDLPAPSIAVSTSSRASTTSAHKSIMTYLNIALKRAYISRELAGLDDSDLVVVFRRGNKEIVSNPAFWDKRSGITTWDQRMVIQTTINRSSNGEILSKEYELALVSRPSNSFVASFSLDFAHVVTTSPGHKSFRLGPKRCLDKNARLEVEISWEFPNGVGDTPSGKPISNTMSSTPRNVSITSHASDTHLHPRHPSEASSVASVSGACECRSLKRQLERKEQQLNQAEIFLKESQKRLGRLKHEQDQLVLREEAETQASLETYAILIRLMQEMELALKFCYQSVHVSQIAAGNSCTAARSEDPVNEADLLPKLELLDRIKLLCHDIQIVRSGGKAHAIKSPGLDFASSFKSFNFQQEIADALDRNEKLHRYLVLLNESFGSVQLSFEELTNMAKSAACQEENAGLISTLRTNNRSYLTMNEQMNRLERENVLLKAKIKNLELSNSANKSGSGTAKEPQLPAGTNSLSDLLWCTNSDSPTCNSSIIESESSCSKSLNVVSEIQSDVDTSFNVNVSEGDDEPEQLHQTNLSLVNQLDLAKKEFEPLSLTRSSTNNTIDTTTMLRVSGMNSLCSRPFGAGKPFSLVDGLTDLCDSTRLETEKTSTTLQETLNMLHEEKERYRYLAAETSLSSDPAPSQEEIEARIEAQFETKFHELEAKHAKEKDEWAQLRENQVEQEKTLCKTIDQLRLEMSNLNVSNVSVSDLQKQLKNAKQEAMELRYRSNASELLQNQLEEATKEKKAMEVKLTALEGQLFEHRGRGISDICFSEQKEQQIRDLTSQVEQLRQQNEELMKANCTGIEAEHLSATGGDVDQDRVEALSQQLAIVVSKVDTLCEQNAKQERQSVQIQLRLQQEQQFRQELEKVIVELTEEMENFQSLASVTTVATSISTPTSMTGDAIVDGTDEMICLTDAIPRKKSLPLLQSIHQMAVSRTSESDDLLPSLKKSPARSDSKVAMLIQSFTPKC